MTEALQAGDMVGEYRVEKKLGEGGMGAVFAGVHPRIGKKVAIKVLNQAMASNPQIVTRFENEARAVNAIGNRHIVDIFSFGALDNGTPYFVMEWLIGIDLDGFLRSRDRMSLSEVLPIFRQVCRALAAAHKNDIVHRDLKPENIFLTPDPDGSYFVKLLDFGIAKFHGDQAAETQTRAGSMMGTPQFMSPEQALGQGVDHRTDIYAMAIMLYRMICGRYPFEGAAMVIISAHLSAVPEAPSNIAPDVSEQLEELILKNLAKSPDDRHQNISEFMAAIELCGAAEPAPAPIASTLVGERLAEPMATIPIGGGPSKSKFYLVAGVVAALALGGAAFALLGKGESSQAPAAAGQGDENAAGETDSNVVAPLLRMPAQRGFRRGSEYVSPSADESK